MKHMKLLHLLALSGFGASSYAQDISVLESVIVTGEQSTDALVKPFTLIDKDTLNNKGAGSVGEALRYTPGMDTTHFGPNASRPIVRGQDADRVKILRNSASTVDVSALSFDHGVPVDPFSLTQVEVLRGPSSLAYGGNAVGGAVNLVDSRIARERVIGVNGEFNAIGNGAAQQSAGGFSLNAGAGEIGGRGISLHLDGFRRTTGDLKTPEFTDPDGLTGKRVLNSSSKSSGAGFGLSVQTNTGYVGMSVEQFNSNYGVPKSFDVRIDQASERYALEGEQKLTGVLSSAKYRLAHTDYQHQEFEDGSPATLFTNRGVDGRIELGHTPFQLGPLSLSGTFGAQFENTDFSAIGEEAFVPSTSTDQTSAFYILKAKGKSESSGTFEVGIRSEQIQVDAASTGLSPIVGPVVGLGVTEGPAANRSFTPNSVSFGYTQPMGGGWKLGASASRVERAPSAFELFADGEHVATDAYEKGNPTLDVESGRHFEVTWSWSEKGSGFSATAFKSQFDNYITLISRNTETFNGTPVFDFTAVPAHFQGVELSYHRLYTNSMGKWKPGLQFDSVKGERKDGGGNLPRISPQRVIASLDYSQKGWTIRPELIWVADSKGASVDPVTEGHQLINLRIAKTFDATKLMGGISDGGALAGEFFANLSNLTDELAYSASTISTVRNYTPLQGRSALVGIKILF
jgi:iron complex outermembrane receptor protein